MITPVNEFGLIIPSVADGTQPTTTFGTSITPGTSNAYGSYTSVLAGASLTADAYAIDVIISLAYADATDRGMLVTVGFDPAGGTSFSGLGGVSGNEISHLLCSQQFQWFSGTVPSGGMRYHFPVFIKSGTSIGAKAQTNAAAAGTGVRVAVIAYCKPSRPEMIRAGSFVRTFGANTTTTDGASVTQGTASEGSWTSIGTAADKLWYLETGVGSRTATQVASIASCDVAIGDGSNKRVVVQDIVYVTRTDEASFTFGRKNAYCNITSGDVIYGRSQAQNAMTGFSMTAYCVGG